MADGGSTAELLRRPIDEVLIRAQRALESGRRSVERSHQRVRDSQFMLQIAAELRARSEPNASQ